MIEINTIKISQKEKQQLSFVKKKTGVENWNVLCRWALCLSLQEKTVPPMETLVSDSNVEMSWKVFGGSKSEIYHAILIQAHCEQKKHLDDISLNDFLKLHLARGISYLVKRHQNIFNF